MDDKEEDSQLNVTVVGTWCRGITCGVAVDRVDRSHDHREVDSNKGEVTRKESSPN